MRYGPRGGLATWRWPCWVDPAWGSDSPDWADDGWRAEQTTRTNKWVAVGFYLVLRKLRQKDRGSPSRIWSRQLCVRGCDSFRAQGLA